MSAEKRDIKNLKEVVDFGFEVSKAGLEIFSGGFKAEKLGQILNIIPTVGPAFEGISDIPAEIADLSAEEVAELSAHVAAKGVLPDKVEVVLDRSLRVAFAAWDLVQAIRGVV